MKVGDKTIEGQWDVALRDLDFAIGLDQDGNGELTWGEIRARHQDIAAYALGRLTLANAGANCPITAGQQLIDNHSDGAYSVLRFIASCSAPIEKLEVDYRLLFDIDPQHRGLLHLQSGGQASTAIFSPASAHQTLVLRKASKLAQFGDYVTTGIWHIWKGFDHILFLLSLLLPAVLKLGDRQPRPSDSFKASFIDVLKIVTAFTLAHSITLTLASLQVISLPSRWIESAIAASVVLAALNNLFPLIYGKRWMVEPEDPNMPDHRTFESVDGELEGGVYFDPNVADRESLAQLALMAAQKESPEARITREEWRKVGALSVLYLEIDVSEAGSDPEVMVGEYFTGTQGTIALVMQLPKDKLPERRAEIDAVLGGLVSVNPFSLRAN